MLCAKWPIDAWQRWAGRARNLGLVRALGDRTHRSARRMRRMLDDARHAANTSSTCLAGQASSVRRRVVVRDTRTRVGQRDLAKTALARSGVAPGALPSRHPGGPRASSLSGLRSRGVRRLRDEGISTICRGRLGATGQNARKSGPRGRTCRPAFQRPPGDRAIAWKRRRAPSDGAYSRASATTTGNCVRSDCTNARTSSRPRADA